MRKLVVTSIVLAGTVLAAAGTSAGDRAVGRVTATGAVSVRVPAGWHVLHGWLSDVVDPSPRLAVAAFAATLSRHTCACGFPNVVNFPRDGAFMFVWEALPPLRPPLARVRPRPLRFRLTGRGLPAVAGSGTPATARPTASSSRPPGACSRWRSISARRSRRPSAPAVRERMATALDSLHAAVGS